MHAPNAYRHARDLAFDDSGMAAPLPELQHCGGLTFEGRTELVSNSSFRAGLEKPMGPLGYS